MKEAHIHQDASSSVHDVPVPTPGKGQVLLRVVVFGTNPKDWKYPARGSPPYNSGDDVAGYVEAVGDDVFQFRKGDRVAGFHHVGEPAGSFAEYALIPAYAGFLIPPSISFEEAATIPLAAMTAIVALYGELALPPPWRIRPADEKKQYPLVIYGASTAVGAFAIKLAKASEVIHPLIVVGSKSSTFVTDEYLDASKGDALIDYTAYDSQAALADAIKLALVNALGPDACVHHAFDTVALDGTFDKVLVPVLSDAVGKGEPKPLVVSVLPPPVDTLNGVDGMFILAAWIFKSGFAGNSFATAWYALLADGLQKGWFKPHPYEIMPNGLEGLGDALKALRDGKVRAKKMVGRIRDTPGL